MVKTRSMLTGSDPIRYFRDDQLESESEAESSSSGSSGSSSSSSAASFANNDDDDTYQDDQEVHNNKSPLGKRLFNGSSTSASAPASTTTIRTRPVPSRRASLNWLRLIRKSGKFTLKPVRQRVGICFFCNQIKTLTQQISFGDQEFLCGKNCAKRITLACSKQHREHEDMDI